MIRFLTNFIQYKIMVQFTCILPGEEALVISVTADHLSRTSSGVTISVILFLRREPAPLTT